MPNPSAGAGTEAPTIEERIDRGLRSGRVDADEIIPFPENWGDDLHDLNDIRRGDRYTEIIARINEGWSTRLHRFRAPDGRVILITLRQDHPTIAKKKVVLPLRVQRRIGIRADVAVRGLDVPRPVYALDQLASRPEAPVLFVEGEKAAEAATLLFPDYVATTWLNGVSGIGAADLRPLQSRSVTIWPDNDDVGRQAATKLANALLAIGAASVRIVGVPSSFPAKWDVADAVPDAAHG